MLPHDGRGVDVVRTDESKAKDIVVEAALAFIDACRVSGNGGTFEVLTHDAKDEARHLFFAVEALVHVRRLKESPGG